MFLLRRKPVAYKVVSNKSNLKHSEAFLVAPPYSIQSLHAVFTSGYLNVLTIGKSAES